MRGDKRLDMVSQPTSSKKPKGRPIGSKNKAKAPIIVKENTDNLMELIVIEIPKGNDVVETLINLSLYRQAGITVLSASGLVSNVTFLHPILRTPNFPTKGTYKMTSLFGTYMNATYGRVPPQLIAEPACSSFSIYVKANYGNYVFGGIVGGKVKAAGAVFITATLLKNPEFHRVAVINGIYQEIEDENTRCVGGVTPIAEDFAPNFGVMGVDSAHLNQQMLPLPTDVNGMHWDISPST
ncbi:AT hook motif DNA-binding family protein [Medicago truncatula]|uniref:AT hook motif DNA-binding family protein n=3 Tax=Medicago truncatula TaxID=3880 RepID=A0A072UKN3_MEDTR|nr:AT hook motif DNA-binding family protein [Medicago truncatula]